MSIVLFLLVLGTLVFVHEFGHFITAKKLGVRVDEFALGFPPKVASIKRGETRYVLNLLPIGGYVKIFGEDPDDVSLSGPDSARSFPNKPKWAQALILLAGIIGNILFAWLLFSLGFMIGMPTSLAPEDRDSVSDAKVEIVAVVPDAPGSEAGLKPGDVISRIEAGTAESLEGDALSPDSVLRFIASHDSVPLVVSYERANESGIVTVTPEKGIIKDEPDRAAAGIVMALTATLKYNPARALYEGAIMTGQKTYEVAAGLVTFFKSAFVLKADLSQVTGPVGIVALVGDASRLGLVYLITFTAFISLNLAVINVLPFPALDGGRLLFVLIEAVKGTPISPKIANVLNAGGLILLLVLMAAITYQDILRLF